MELWHHVGENKNMVKVRYVLFSPYGVRIVKSTVKPVVDAETQVLESPVVPAGVPPHMWLLKDGKIEVATEVPQYKPRPPKEPAMKIVEVMKQKYVKPKWRHYLETALIALVVALALKYIKG